MQAEQLTHSVSEGPPLPCFDRALISLATILSVTSINPSTIEDAIEKAFKAGATVAQVQEIAALVSGLGTHSLMVSGATIVRVATDKGLLPRDLKFDRERKMLWDKHVGNDKFWENFSNELPGFLQSMLHLSPDMFVAFFNYCAIPWETGHVAAHIKELAAMACDITPSHCFGPGFRVHLSNVIKLGVGRQAIMEALDIAALAPIHIGYDKGR